MSCLLVAGRLIGSYSSGTNTVIGEPRRSEWCVLGARVSSGDSVRPGDGERRVNRVRAGDTVSRVKRRESGREERGGPVSNSSGSRWE